MKKNRLALIVLLVAFTLGGYAQETYKFGHINTQELLAAMPERQEAQKQYEKEVKSIELELENMQVEYNNKLNNYMSGRDTLSQFVRQAKEEELQTLQQRIQQYQQTAQQSLGQIEQELFQPVMEKARKAIEVVGEREGFIYIFDANSLLYVNPQKSTDIAPLVKQELGIQE